MFLELSEVVFYFSYFLKSLKLIIKLFDFWGYKKYSFGLESS